MQKKLETLAKIQGHLNQLNKEISKLPTHHYKDEILKKYEALREAVDEMTEFVSKIDQFYYKF